MSIIIRILLIAYYPVLVVVGTCRRLLGRDPLQLKRPTGVESFWLLREPQADTQSYFSQASVAEGRQAHYENSTVQTDPPIAPQLAKPLQGLAKLCAPSRTANTGTVSSAADRSKDIPDEIYTLW